MRGCGPQDCRQERAEGANHWRHPSTLPVRGECADTETDPDSDRRASPVEARDVDSLGSARRSGSAAFVETCPDRRGRERPARVSSQLEPPFLVRTVARLGREAQNPLNAMSARPQPLSEAPAEPQASLEFRLLGPIEVRLGGEAVSLGGLRQRALLALLCLNRGTVVAVDRIVDELWGESPPASARHMVEVYVSKLRGLFGPHALLTRSPGYVMEVESQSVDVSRFEGLLAEGEEALAMAEPKVAASRFIGALALWRGPALADFTFEPFAQAEIARLEELKLMAEERRIDAELALGTSAEIVTELEQLIARAPFRERFRAQLMLALYRAGRQADALETYRRARQVLVEDLGVEPGQELRDLERAVLAQEEWLASEPQLPARGVRVTSRRVVTLVLAEIGESRSNADPEAAQPFTAAQLSALEAVLENEGAVVHHFPDGTVMGVFGSPIAHEDDALRGLRAAVELREKRITSRAAVDTGEVLARDDGTVSGPAIRGSTLLLAAAPPGEVLVGEATRRLTAHAAGFGPPVDLDECAGLAAPTASRRRSCSAAPARRALRRA